MLLYYNIAHGNIFSRFIFPNIEGWTKNHTHVDLNWMIVNSFYMEVHIFHFDFNSPVYINCFKPLILAFFPVTSRSLLVTVCFFSLSFATFLLLFTTWSLLLACCSLLSTRSSFAFSSFLLVACYFPFVICKFLFNARKSKEVFCSIK